MPRKQKKYHYIYKTTCQVTGKFYVGMHSTDDLDDGYLGSGKILGYSLAKHGKENHKKEILEFLPDRVALKAREAEIVNEELLADPRCINLKYGGEGGWDHVTGEQRIPGALAMNEKIWTDPAYREAHSARSSVTLKNTHSLGLIKYSTFQGRTHTDKTKQLMSAKAKDRVGEKNNQFGTVWVSKDGIAKKINEDFLSQFIQEGYKRGRKH